MKIGYLMQEGVPDIRKRPLSGAANHVVNVFQEFRKAGHQVRLLVNFDKQIWLSDDLQTFEPVRVGGMDRGTVRCLEKAVRRVQSEFQLPYANYFDSLRFAYACQHALSDADVFFERMGWLGYGAGLAAQKMHVPLVVEVNGDHLDEFQSRGLEVRKSQQYLSYFLMRKASFRVSHVIATGAGWRQKYIERWDVAPSHVSVIENGSALVDLLRREDLRAFQHPEPGTPIRVVYCGGFEAWHGVPVLVQAVRKAVDQGCNLQVVLIGSGTEQKRIIELINGLALEDIFTFTGQVDMDELARHLARADIGVSPYCGRAEYSGLKLLDYKAAGLAIIASGEKNQPSILKHQCTGWIVPPCDELALSRAIITLAGDLPLRTRIGQAARMEAEVLHSWRHTARQLLDVLDSVKKNSRTNAYV